ncbi:MAG TPA: hypothetical protein VJN67_06250 [Stellaceae bacterium]|nr:hypothetical protein [Stellaceae bacterium]
MRFEKATIAIGTEFELGEDRLSLEKTELRERHAKHLQYSRLDHLLKGLDGEKHRTAADVGVFDRTANLHAVYQGGNELRTLPVDVPQEPLHESRTQKIVDDGVGASMLGPVESHGTGDIKRLGYHLASKPRQTLASIIGSIVPPDKASGTGA